MSAWARGECQGGRVVRVSGWARGEGVRVGEGEGARGGVACVSKVGARWGCQGGRACHVGRAGLFMDEQG